MSWKKPSCTGRCNIFWCCPTKRGRIVSLRRTTPSSTSSRPQNAAHAEMRGSMTTITHARAGAGKLFNYLREKHGLRCRPVTEQGLQAVRISTHVFNSPAECERVIAGVRAASRDL